MELARAATGTHWSSALVVGRPNGRLGASLTLVLPAGTVTLYREKHPWSPDEGRSSWAKGNGNAIGRGRGDVTTTTT